MGTMKEVRFMKVYNHLYRDKHRFNRFVVEEDFTLM